MGTNAANRSNSTMRATIFLTMKMIQNHIARMVACSALITPQIEQKTIQVGFDLACESPLRK